ncbi:gamma-glutamyltranspeptidase [Pisolithus sp. B1]|nr:gamma-glutamyltranspeptidase [Pisolithus sp. B1]
MPVVTFDWEKINQPDLVFQRFPSRRPQVYSTKGIVACSQPLAAEAGLEILRRGGNAADAAVATAAALNVTEPSSCGIGGDAFCLFYDAKTEAVKGLNGSGRAPRRLTLELLRQRGIDGSHIPLTDLNSVTVPGAAAAWVDTIHSFGSHKLSVAEVLAPAIRLAEDGVPVSEIHSFSWQRSEKLIKDASPNGGEMLLDGRAPLPGQIMKFPNLAHTFRVLAEQGRDGFYKGEVAKAIVELIQSQGGVMEMEDFATHESTFVEPIKYTYGNEVTVCECPPNGQGITALLALGILEQIQEQGKVKPLLEMEHNSPEYLHTLIEALRQQTVAVVLIGFPSPDSRYYVTDPEFHHIPVNKLLSKDYLAERAHLFNPARANPKVIHGNPVNSSDTAYFTVTDQWGNACSYIQSNYAGFGTGAVPKNCGFTLQNRGAGFVLQEGHPNCLQGGKRPYHTIIPAMALKGDELFLTYGVMGGFMQPQGHVQVLLNILRGFTAQAALDAPRFCISPGTPEAGARDEFSVVNGEVYFEETFPPDTITKLQEMGHDARVASGFDRGKMGRGQVIQKLVDKSGKFVWAAGSDPRADGHAAPQI